MLHRAFWLLQTQFGFDPRIALRSLAGLPRYVRDWRAYRAKYRGPMEFVPCLQDLREEGGATRNEYFWQDLIVARMICAANPRRHIDVGSRIDGFVAHVASFRELEVLDIRPVRSSIPGVIFRQADLMQLPPDLSGACDSLSCLHALEHFGLGRYGDPIDPDGAERGLSTLAAVLADGGTLYLSVPIGRERVEFNANRVFDPRSIVAMAEREGLKLTSFTVVGARGSIESNAAFDEAALARLAGQRYALGIFVLSKRQRSPATN